MGETMEGVRLAIHLFCAFVLSVTLGLLAVSLFPQLALPPAASAFNATVAIVAGIGMLASRPTASVVHHKVTREVRIHIEQEVPADG